MPENALILVADDEEMLRTLATMFLEGEGFRVLEACDGAECVQKYQELGPAEVALVVLDKVMPRMNGVEAFREIRRLNPAAKVILSSGSVDSTIISQLLSEGLSASISKPYSTTQFLATVRRVLDE
jgi:CheY-like chemotaxis protein